VRSVTKDRPPSGGPCQSVKARGVLDNIALLVEGARISSRLV